MVNKVLGLVGLATKAGKVISGTDVCIEAINKRKVWIIIIATDAAERTKENFKFLCKDTNVKLIEFGLIDEVSKAIGKENRAVVGIRDKKFAEQVIKLIDGGNK